MRSEVTVTFKDAAPLRMDLDRTEPMAQEAAREWLDRQFTELGCEPLRPTGKVLAADKIVVIAQAAGPARFADAGWADQFARAASASLDKPVVHVDVPGLTIGF
jgi:hypothetical protein